MRDLSKKKNVMEIQDGVSGDIHELFYRLPTNTEIAAFHASCFAREGNTIKVNVHGSRVQYGLLVLEGFTKGSFGLDGKPFASDPADADYMENWKDILREEASDILAVFAVQVFEGTKVRKGGGVKVDFVGGSGGDGGTDKLPLAPGLASI
jgi:hypothetical protein